MTTTNTNFLPAQTGLDLGATNQRWDVFAQTLDVGTLNSGAVLMADYFDSVQDAINNLPTAGGTVDARSPDVNLALSTIDPGTKSVTLLLGPYTYTFTQITLQTSFRILGSAPQPGVTANAGTILQSIADDSTPAMILGSQPTTGVVLQDFRLYGNNASNTGSQPGMKFQAALNGGIWWSEFNNLYIANFGGIVIEFDGSAASNSINQFNVFRHCTIFRNTYDGVNPNYCLHAVGTNGQFGFYDCQFDGQYNTADAGENIRIEATSATGFILPYSFTFRNSTIQFSSVGVHLIGALGMNFLEGHHEALYGCYLIDYTPSSGVGDWGTNISGNYFANGCGVNGGNGYLAKITSAAITNADVTFTNNGYYNTPDVTVAGAGSANAVTHDNFSLVGTVGGSYSGTTPTVAPASLITTYRARVVNLSNSATPIDNISSSVSPGDSITFICGTGAATFTSTGNINLGGYASVTISPDNSITFVASDANASYNLVGIGKSILPSLTADGPPSTTVGGQVSFGYSFGFGNGTPATAVTTTTLGTGSGPTNAGTVIGYMKVIKDGFNIWIPYFI